MNDSVRLASMMCLVLCTIPRAFPQAYFPVDKAAYSVSTMLIDAKGKSIGYATIDGGKALGGRITFEFDGGLPPGTHVVDFHAKPSCKGTDFAEAGAATLGGSTITNVRSSKKVKVKFGELSMRVTGWVTVSSGGTQFSPGSLDLTVFEKSLIVHTGDAQSAPLACGVVQLKSALSQILN